MYTLPPSLLERFSVEERLIAFGLEQAASTSELLPQSKDYAERRLTSLVPKALDTYDSLMEPDVDDKVRIQAANAVIAAAPPTRKSDFIPTASVSQATLEAALVALASLFGAPTLNEPLLIANLPTPTITMTSLGPKKLPEGAK